MDYFSKNRVLIAALVVLVLLNVATLTFLLLRRPPDMGPREGPGRPSVARYLNDELGFSQAQMQQFDVLRAEHQRKVESIMRDLHGLKDSLFDMMKSDNAGSERVRQQAALIGQKEAEMDIATFEHFSKVRTLCTPDQQKKFDVMIRDVLRMLAPPPPPRPEK